MKWYDYSPYGTTADICLFICGQVEELSVTLGCLYWAGLPFWERVCKYACVCLWGVTDTWHTWLAGLVPLWHFLSALCPPNAWMRTHAQKEWHTLDAPCHAHSSTLRLTYNHTHRHTLPEDYKHHSMGHRERCFFAVQCAWPMMRRFAFNILSLQIVTSHWPSIYKPAAGKPGLQGGFIQKPMRSIAEALRENECVLAENILFFLFF